MTGNDMKTKAMKKRTETILSASLLVGALCAQAAAPKYGGLHFDAAVEIDGVRHPAGTTVYAETYPTQMLVRPVVPEGKTFQWYATQVPRGTYLNSRASQNSFYSGLNATFPTVRLSRPDGAYLMTPPGDRTVVITNRAVYAAQVVYVATNGTDVASAGDETAPFGTIQYAVDYLYRNHRGQNAIVLVKPGVYDKGGYEGDADNFRSRVFVEGDQSVLIKSTDGAGVTVIEGELDPESDDGCGPRARRCVTFRINAGGVASIQGFTFRKGRTLGSEGGQRYTNQGGGIGAQRSNYGISQHVAADCVFADCRAGYGSWAAWNMWLFRCRVTGSGSLATSCCASTRVDGPGCGLGWFAFQSSAAGDCGVLSLNSACGRARLATAGVYYGSVHVWNGKDGEPVGYTSATDHLVSLADGDVRPVEGGAAQFGARVPAEGSDDWLLWTDVMAALACGDVNGDPVAWRDGVPMSGAVMETVRLRAVSVTKPREVGLAATGLTLGETATSVTLPAGAVITLAPSETGTRYASAVVCGGVTNRFRDLPGGVFAYTVEDGEGPVELEILRANEWYADACGGDDANTGFTRETAVKTLACGMRKCVKGDTLYALPGVYGEGVTDRGGGDPAATGLPRCRAFIRPGTTLASTDGPEATVILGAAATTADADAHGRGEDAVSCVRVQSATASNGAVALRGFTLTGGRTRYDPSAGLDGNELVSGAAFHALWSSRDAVTLENCIVTNNFGQMQTVSSDTTCIGCLFDGNVADSASVTHKSRLLGCLVKGGSASNLYGCRSCTFGPGSSFNLEGGHYECVDSLLMGKVGWHANTMTFTNCVFLSGCERYGRVDCLVTNEAAIAVDTDFRPQSAQSVVVDGAGADDPADASLLAARDARGGQRVCNGTPDIGAVEYDWLREYSRDLLRNGRFSVASASPTVVEGEGRSLLLPSGASVAGRWRTGVALPESVSVKVRILGNGTFTVRVGGETVVSLEGPVETPQDVSFPAVAGADVAFGYCEASGEDVAATGRAEILRLGFVQGLLLLVR